MIPFTVNKKNTLIYLLWRSVFHWENPDMVGKDLRPSSQSQAHIETCERSGYTGGKHPKEEAVLWKEGRLCSLRQPSKQGFCGFQAK